MAGEVPASVIWGVNSSITSTLLRFFVRLLKSLPRSGKSPKKGIFWSVFCSSSEIKPPITSV